MAEKPKTCGECAVFNPVNLLEECKLRNGDRANGQCRFYAPSSHSYPVFPQVYSDEIACGQARPKGAHS